jgi:hypothetical protein
MPPKAYASERITVYFAAIFLLSNMEMMASGPATSP